jgi:hypothetical protein
MFFILIRTSNLEAENDGYPVKLSEDVVMAGFIVFRAHTLLCGYFLWSFIEQCPNRRLSTLAAATAVQPAGHFSALSGIGRLGRKFKRAGIVSCSQACSLDRRSTQSCKPRRMFDKSPKTGLERISAVTKKFAMIREFFAGDEI